MALRLLALEWDEAEARVVLATRKGRNLRIDAAVRVEVAEGGTPEERQLALRQKVRDVLDEHRVTKADCLLAVGRSAVELKHLSLPPAPDSELPEMVRFQALREFATIGEDWPIDFLPIDHDPEQPRHVLAATINPQLVERLSAGTQELGLDVKSIVVRPCGMASLVGRQFALADHEAYLLIDPLDKQMDLAVLQGKSVVFLRSARADSSAQGEESLKSITLEVRRTIAAAANRLGGQLLTAIYLCGSGESQQAWAARLRAEFNVPVHTFDPFAGLELSDQIKSSADDHHCRYAPLVGMLLDAAEEHRQSIDFLNPRRTIVQTVSRRKSLLIAAAVLAFVGLFTGWIWYELRSLDSQERLLIQESLALDETVKRAEEIERKVADVDKWAASDVAWLDELYRLSAQFPPAEQAMVTQLRAQTRTSGGEMQLDGLLKTAATVDELERRLRDPKHALEQKAGQQSDKDPRYRWTFKSSLIVQGPELPVPARARRGGTAPRGTPARGTPASGTAAVAGGS